MAEAAQRADFEAYHLHRVFEEDVGDCQLLLQDLEGSLSHAAVGHRHIEILRQKRAMVRDEDSLLYLCLFR